VPPTPDSRPRLALGCRLSDASGTEATLLMPERAMKLNGPGLEIVRRCDGQRTLGAIVAELKALYPTAPPATLEQEALQFVERLWERRALDLE
jgi:pyrroloquinoline quinone biosynthesis protein D